MNHKKVTFGQRWVRLAMLLSLFLIHDSVLKAEDVTLSWTANSEADLAAYKLHYGTSSRNYTTSVNLAKVTNYIVTGLNAGTYYFALTAYDTSGFASDRQGTHVRCTRKNGRSFQRKGI